MTVRHLTRRRQCRRKESPSVRKQRCDDGICIRSWMTTLARRNSGLHAEMRRRETIPQELEDLEDCTIGESEGDSFEPDPSHGPHPSDLSKNGLKQETSFRKKVSEMPKEFRNIIAGGIAGMIAKSIVAPFDRIKILYQVSSAEFHLSNLPRVARNIIQNEGPAALWKGNTVTMIRVFPYSGIQFMVFERAKGYFLREHERGRYLDTAASDVTPEQRKKHKYGLTPLESLISGMIAGTVSVISTYPLDLARAQLAVLKRHRSGSGKNTGFTGILSFNYQKGGTQGLFRGITPTLLGILPYSGVAFTLNEQGKREIQHMTGRDVKTIERLQCGAFAGLVAQTLTYPIEVTRRRMQTIGLVDKDTALSNLGTVKEQQHLDRPPSLSSTVRGLYLEQGFRGFFKGVSVNWMKGPIAFSISFTAFDLVQGLMESEAERAKRLPRRFFTIRREKDSNQ